jgi:putative peptidoglycan lipid II flippase
MTENTSKTTSPTPPVRRSSARNILTVMSGTLSSRVLGLLRQTLFNRFFDTQITEAFNIAYRVPNLFRELLAEGALSNSIIPVYKNLKPNERKQFSSSFLALLIAVNFVIVGLGILLAPLIVEAIAHKASAEIKNTATMLVRIVMPFLAGISFSALAMGLLNAEEKFSATSFAPLAFNVISILGFVLFPNNAVMLGWGTTIGGFAQLLVQIPSLRRFGLMPGLSTVWHPGLTRALRLMGPFAFTTSVRQFLAIILTNLLAGFPKGTITGFGNAEVIFLMFQGLFAVSPATAAYPRMSEFAAQKDWAQFRETLANYARLVLFLSAGVSAMMFVLGPSMVSSVIELSGVISDDKYLPTLAFMPSFALAIAPWGLVQLLTRAFYARERTRDAVAISVVAFAMNTLLYILLAPRGFAIMNYATAITGWVMVGVYVAVLVKQIDFNWKKLVGHSLKVALAAVVAAFVASFISSLIPLSRGAINGILHLVVAGGLGMLVYLVSCSVLQVQEVAGLRRRFFKR